MNELAIANTGSFASAFSVNENAGFVIGAQGGYANEHWDNLAPSSSSVNDTGFAARGYIGYDVNQFFGFESGYTYLPKTTVDGQSGNVKNYAIDLLAKLSIPVSSVLNIYAKAGEGYLNSRFSGGGAGYANDQTNTHIGPVFGVGAAYEIIPNLAIDVSWMRYSGQGNIANGSDFEYQPSPDALLLGVSYKFPVRYS